MGVPPSVDQVIQPVDTMGFFIAKMINYPYEKSLMHIFKCVYL